MKAVAVDGCCCTQPTWLRLLAATVVDLLLPGVEALGMHIVVSHG